MSTLGVDVFYNVVTTFCFRQEKKVVTNTAAKTLEEALQLRKDQLSKIYEALNNQDSNHYYLCDEVIVDLRDVIFVACYVEDHTSDAKRIRRIK